MKENENVMNGLTASQMVKAVLVKTGKTQAELAEYMGWSKENVSRKLKNEALTFGEIVKVLALGGYSVKIVNGDDEELPALNNSDSPRVTRMVEGVVYDTAKAESICSSRGVPSDELYMELFKDVSGAFFLAYYQLWEGGHNHITPMTNSAAKRFYQRYGDGQRAI